MLVQQLPNTFNLAVTTVWTNLLSYIPKIVFAILLFIVGWLIAAVLGKLVTQLIKATKFDKLLQAAGFDDFLKRMELKSDSAQIFGAFIKWSTIIIFFTLALEILNLTQVSQFMWEEVLPFVPKVIVAALILIIGAVVGDKVKLLILGSGKAVNIASAKLIANFAKAAFWIFALLVAVSQLGVAKEIITVMISGIVFAVSLAFGLAFGLGGKDAAAKYLEKLQKDIEPENKD